MMGVARGVEKLLPGFNTYIKALVLFGKMRNGAEKYLEVGEFDQK